MIIRPEVFISATSKDLRTCRDLIKNALLTLGCVPVEQTTFPPDTRSVREMLRAKIASCHAIIHVAGEVYGAEPASREIGEPRRSYTQIEYDVARKLEKPVYVFVCGDGFPYDAHDPEDEERQALQREHRTRLQGSDHFFTPVCSRDELALRVQALQTRVEQLGKDLSKSRSLLGRGLALGLVLLLLLGGGLWVAYSRLHKTEVNAERTERKLATMEMEIEKQRCWLKAVAETYGQQQAGNQKLTEEERFRMAVASVAEQVKLKPAEMQSGIDLFIAAVKANPTADFYDRALAEFAERNFSKSAVTAGQAAEEAHKQRLAAEQMASKMKDQAKAARARERDARALQGKSLHADYQYHEAVEAFEQALSITPRAESAEEWARLTVLCANSLNCCARTATGGDISKLRTRAVMAYRAALEVRTRERFLHDWARTQNNLGIALCDQASASHRDERVRLFGEAVQAYRFSLEGLSREFLPREWAMTQNNLGIALSDQASASPGTESAQILAEAVHAYYAALEIHTREVLPREWAMTQNNLGIALVNQAGVSRGEARTRLLTEAVRTYRDALEVRTRESMPQEWAMTQNNLGVALSSQAHASPTEERDGLLAEAVQAYRAALEIITFASLPQDWAMTQNNLGFSLLNQANASLGEERGWLLAEAAVQAYHAALEVYTRESMPEDWARTQVNLIIAFAEMHRYGEAYAISQEVENYLQCQRSVDSNVLANAGALCSYFASHIGISRDAVAYGEKSVSLLDHDKACPARMNLAHAYLFNGQFDKAKAIHAKYLGTAFEDGRKWNDELRNDFKTLREAGHNHPDMKKIEAMLGEGE